MALDVRIWAVDVSEYTLWSTVDDDKGKGLIASLLRSEDEQKRVTRFVREIDQIRSLAGKLLVRLSLCTSFPHVAWHDIVVNTTPEGKPYVQEPGNVAFEFNLTHDGDWVAIAFATVNDSQTVTLPKLKLGIDVMEIHLPPYEESVASFVETMDMTLTQRERQWIMNANELEDRESISKLTDLSPLNTLAEQDQARLFRLYNLWTYKEAFTKAHGVGLSFDFARIEIALWRRRTAADEDADEVIEIAKKEGHDKLCQLAFFDVLLPPGKLHRSDEEIHSPIGPGRGTGRPSLLVIASSRPTRADERQVQPYAVEAEQAEKEGILTRLSMNELVRKCQSARGSDRIHGKAI